MDNLDKTASIVISKNVAEVQNDIAAVVARMLGPNRAPVEILIGKMVEKDGIATTGVEAVRSSRRQNKQHVNQMSQKVVIVKMRQW